VSKVDDYRVALEGLDSWDDFLRSESGLPGPRGNLELMRAYADLVDPEQAHRHADIGPEEGPENTPEGFLAVCGTRALGRLLLSGADSDLDRLERAAADPRWRVREAAAMAIQDIGAKEPARAARITSDWSSGGRFLQRAAVAAVCEPSLLKTQAAAERALKTMEAITQSLLGAEDQRDDGFKALRKALGYGWSVLVVANPAIGKPAFERWLAVEDRNIRWLVRQNLRKARLRRMDPAWLDEMRARADG
jgi:hypothetical protein